MCVIVKTRCFYGLPISHNQIKKLSTLFLRYLPRKTQYSRFSGGIFEFEILEIFTRAFLLKSILWIWIFFKHCRVLSLKMKQKIFSKKSPKNCLTVDMLRDGSKTLKKGKEKRKMRKIQTTAFLLFCIGNFIFC